MTIGLQQLIEEYTQQHRRSQKQAADDGTTETSHPVGSSDNGTQPTPEGARSKENNAYLSSGLGEAVATGQEDASKAEGKSIGPNMGIEQQGPDEVKGNVPKPGGYTKAPAEGGQGDASPGHPTNEAFNEKYSSAGSAARAGRSLLDELDRAQGIKVASNKGGPTGSSNGSPSPGTAGGAADPLAFQKAAAERNPDSHAAGYAAAEMLLTQLAMRKQAEEQSVAMVAQLRKAAHEDGERWVNYYHGYLGGLQEQSKRAMDGAPPTDIPPEVLAAMAGGGGGEGMAGAPGEMPGMGGESPMPPDTGMGGSEEEILQAIAQQLAAEGIDPAELQAALGGMGGGGEGGGGEAAASPEGAERGGGEEAEEAAETPAEEKEEHKEAKARRLNKAASPKLLKAAQAAVKNLVTAQRQSALMGSLQRLTRR